MVLEQRRKTTARYTAAVAVAVLLAACGAEDTPPPNSAELPPSIEQLQAEAAPFAGRSVSDLRGDPSALATGRRLFEARCASCHGADARGGRNVTDLVDGVFAYGGSESAIRTTIGQGRTSVMPDMGSSLGEVDLGQLVAYVQSLNFEAPLSSYAERGKMLFEANCAKCHGADGHADTPVGKAMKVPPLATPKWAADDDTDALIAAFHANPKHKAVASKVTDDDLRAIAVHVRALAAAK